MWSFALLMSLAFAAPTALATPFSRRECNLYSTSPIDLVDPPEASGYCKQELDVCPSIFLSIERIHRNLAKSFPGNMSFYAVNIGANDGKSADPLYSLLEKQPDFGILQIEPSNDLFPKLKSNMAGFPNVEVLQSAVTVATAREVAKSKMTPVKFPRRYKSMDVMKIDVDVCDCHILQDMLADPFYHAKIIQIELNHHIPPPIAYMDMCANDIHGRSTKDLDVWGCSMQAAYNIVRPYGYELLQHDWPDAVFVHSMHRHAFPCILDQEVGAAFEHNYWIGYWHAHDKYTRFRAHQTNRSFVRSLPVLALKGHLNPKSSIQAIVDAKLNTWTKLPLWVEMSIGNTRLSVTSNPSGGVKLLWKTGDQSVTQLVSKTRGQTRRSSLFGWR